MSNFYTIKPLEWEKKGGCFYADTPFGAFMIPDNEDYGYDGTWEWYFRFGELSQHSGEAPSLWSAKFQAEKFWQDTLNSCFDKF